MSALPIDSLRSRWHCSRCNGSSRKKNPCSFTWYVVMKRKVRVLYFKSEKDVVEGMRGKLAMATVTAMATIIDDVHVHVHHLYKSSSKSQPHAVVVAGDLAEPDRSRDCHTVIPEPYTLGTVSCLARNTVVPEMLCANIIQTHCFMHMFQLIISFNLNVPICLLLFIVSGIARRWSHGSWASMVHMSMHRATYVQCRHKRIRGQNTDKIKKKINRQKKKQTALPVGNICKLQFPTQKSDIIY